MVNDESGLPYDRPPLSKQVLTDKLDLSGVILRDAGTIAKLQLDWIASRRAVALRMEKKQVGLNDGRVLPFDKLLVSTGVIPRQLPGLAPKGAHVLRTLSDALALRDHFGRARRVLVIGAGFLGTECAAAASKLGLEAILAFPETHPLQAVLGSVIGERVGDMHAANRVLLRPERIARQLVADGGHVKGAVFDDGSVIEADLVIVAIGSVPDTSWLDGNGLDLIDGVGCDSSGLAGHSIYAAGDVARWHHSLLGAAFRMEHRTNAAEQGVIAARAMLGKEAVLESIPFAWTDQYGMRLRMYGRCSTRAQIEVENGAGSGTFLARFWQDRQIVGVAGCGDAKGLRALCDELTESLRRRESLSGAREVR